MKLASYRHDGRARLGVVQDDTLIDLQQACVARQHAAEDSDAATIVPSSMTAFLEDGAAAIDAAVAAVDFVSEAGAEVGRQESLIVPLAEVDLLTPVPDAPKIICVARNYAEHAREAGLQISEIPIVFARFHDSLVAHRAPLVRPIVSGDLDWEGELAVVIGKRGRRLTRETALEHVAGYTVFNDGTVRDYQFRVSQYTSGKNFWASGSFGPYLVLADEVEDPHALEITTEVNGEVKQRANTRDMIYDIPTILEHISEWIELRPGDVIATGTPSGVGFKRDPPEFLAPGDTVSVTVSQVGTLCNPVIAEEDLTR